MSRPGPRLDHPSNAGIVRHLRGGKPDARSGPPEAFDDPYMRLGSHPDLVEILWETVPAALPKPRKARWVLFGTPVLFHPGSGVVVAVSGGTLTYALRLPPEAVEEALARGAERSHAYSDGSVVDLGLVGPDWLFCGRLPDPAAWGKRSFDYAERLER